MGQERKKTEKKKGELKQEQKNEAEEVKPS